ncbi:MAG: hypothetical protein AB7I25_10610 [Vicinamibacterales bacterium]
MPLHMRSSNVVIGTLAVVMVAVWSAACGQQADTATPVATPTVTLARPDAVIGGPIEMTFKWAVAQDAPAFPADGWVFVHFLDADGELLWTDDHEPPGGMAAWTPGRTVEYTRTTFAPKLPYVGELMIEIGAFSRGSGQRLPLAGTTTGQRSYQAGRLNLRLQGESLLVVFKDGWHATEQAEGSTREWQWSKGTGTLAFRNPKRDATLYLEVDRPGGMPEPQVVTVRLGDAVVDTFELKPGDSLLRRVALSAAQLGDADAVEVQIAVDRTFVPAALPGSASGDTRELGIRVFRAFVEAR